MRFTLRDYQADAIDRTVRALPRRPVLVAPTGSGKTVMAAAIVETLDRPTLWLAHRKELIDQGANHLRALGLQPGIIMAGYEPDPTALVHVASVQTLVRRDPPPVDLFVIDEAHHARAETYRAILEKHPHASVIGLTATPFRLDGRGLGDVFGEIVVAAYADDLCTAGTLHSPRVFAGATPSMDGVRVRMGDYSAKETEELTLQPQLVADIVKTWIERAEGTKTVAFAVSVAHSKAIVNAFCLAGFAAEHIDGTTPRDRRDAILDRLRTGETAIVSNCMVLTEGWDLPALETAIIARPTASLNLHLQMIGRIMRSCPGKVGATVLDHAGNYDRHGFVTRRLEYSLDSEHRTGETEPLGLRRCPQCGLLFDTSLPECPECEWKPDHREKSSEGVHNEGELVEVFDNFDMQQAFWNTTEEERERRDYRAGWSAFRFKERFGEWPTVVDGRLIDPDSASMPDRRAVFKAFALQAQERGYKPGWIAHRYKDTFGCWPRGFVRDVRRELGIEV